ncbi:MAG: hypothetical protein KGD67_12705, partial [Candidatus Lokiarchaeota archaeon]|nr:hypothetical protein [Candidatus Lokiarchaeota archaeon]
MFKIIRINRKKHILLFALFLISSSFTLALLSHNNLNIEESDDISDRITNELVSIKTASTIESTTITTETQYTTDFVVDMPSFRPDGD